MVNKKYNLRAGLPALRAQARQAGVTLIELLVVLAIVAAVSSIMIFNYSDFSSNVSLRTISQEVALAVRKAQTYATSVHSIQTLGTSSTSYPAYGISFAVGGIAPDSATPGSNQFIIFADIGTIGNGLGGSKDGSEKDGGAEEQQQEAQQEQQLQSMLFDMPGWITARAQQLLNAGGGASSGLGGASANDEYDNGGNCGNPEAGNECIESLGITTADRIVKICSDVIMTSDNCTDTGQVDIVFRRPSPDARICVRGSGTAECTVQKASYARIVLESLKGLQKSISIWNTGQISVQ